MHALFSQRIQQCAAKFRLTGGFTARQRHAAARAIIHSAIAQHLGKHLFQRHFVPCDTHGTGRTGIHARKAFATKRRIVDQSLFIR